MSRYDKLYLIEITNFYIYDIAMCGSSLIAQKGRAIQPDPVQAYTASVYLRPPELSNVVRGFV